MVTSADVLKIAGFSDGKRGGNPAGVVIGDHLPSPEVMQAIAADMGFSETALAAPGDREHAWVVRYYSPEIEVPFCGHATISLIHAESDQLFHSCNPFAAGGVYEVPATGAAAAALAGYLRDIDWPHAGA